MNQRKNEEVRKKISSFFLGLFRKKCVPLRPKTLSAKKENSSEQTVVEKGRLTAMRLVPWGAYMKRCLSRFVLDEVKA
jgi:hypothetical protein